MSPKVVARDADSTISKPVLRCPNCSSGFLMIRMNRGFERIMIFLTGQRKYICRDCEQSFRATDRRRIPREGRMPADSRTNPA